MGARAPRGGPGSRGRARVIALSLKLRSKLQRVILARGVVATREELSCDEQTMMRAAVSSGRSERDSSAFSNTERPVALATAALSTGAEPPSGVAWKDAVRTVTTFFVSVDCTVWMALPA